MCFVVLGAYILMENIETKWRVVFFVFVGASFIAPPESGLQLIIGGLLSVICGFLDCIATVFKQIRDAE